MSLVKIYKDHLFIFVDTHLTYANRVTVSDSGFVKFALRFYDSLHSCQLQVN
jgi:hypothetical protein